MGPTASGKSDTALAIAKHLDAEIISVDSMQVYRGMDIGTAKPTPAERAEVRHHLIDVCEPDQDFSVADSQRLGRSAIEDAPGPVIIAGGTGLAFRAIVDPMEFPGEDAVVRSELEELDLDELQRRLRAADPEVDSVLDMANPRRVVRALEVLAVTGLTPSARAAAPAAAAVRAYEPVIPFRAVGLDPGRGLEARVVARFDRMLAAGLLDEVGALVGRMSRTAAQAVGYKELVPVLAGERSLEEGRAAAISATLAVARNQRTFWRRDPRIRWLEWDDDRSKRLERAGEVLRG